MEFAYTNLGSPENEILPGVFARTETDGFGPHVVGTLSAGMFDFKNINDSNALWLAGTFRF